MLLQPLGSSSVTSTPTLPIVSQSGQHALVQQDPNSQFVEGQGQFMPVDPAAAGAPHFLPQPFPVHQQQMPTFTMGQPAMPDQPFPGFPNDPSMFQPQIPIGPQSLAPGQQFYTEGMPPHMTPSMLPGPHSFQGPHVGSGFGPGMFPPGPLHPMDPNVMPPSHPVHMEHHRGHMGPGPETNLHVDIRSSFPEQQHAGPIIGPCTKDAMNIPGPHSHQDTAHVPVTHVSKAGPTPGHHHHEITHMQDHQKGSKHMSDSQWSVNIKTQEPEEDRDRTPIPDFDEDDENALEFKHGFGGPGIPGHPALKTVYQKDDETKTKEKRRRGKRVSRFEPIKDDIQVKEEPKQEAIEVSGKTAVEDKLDEIEKAEKSDLTESSKLIEERTGFGKWHPVSPRKESVASTHDQESGLQAGQQSEAEFGTPQSQSEDFSDSDAGAGKPMKVKSRWRRASEAEIPPPPPPPSKKDEKESKAEDTGETEGKDDEEIPINFELIDENVYLAER